MGECIFTNRGGKPKKLPVLNSSYPADKSLTFIAGNTATATFEVKIATAGYPEEYTYQWYMDGSAVSGATASAYIWTGTEGTHEIYCEVTNKAGTVRSRTATLTVEKYYLPVLNSSYPANASKTYIDGNTASATFEVKIATAGNPATYTYQWYLDGSAVSGATGSSYTWSGTEGTYTVYCKVTNAAGAVQSRTATLSVVRYYTPTLNSSHPVNDTAMRGNRYATFYASIATHGNPATYTYQWYLNGSAYSGATSNSFSFSYAQPVGTYTLYCKVTNAAGTVQTRTATITLMDTFLWNWGDVTAISGGWQMTKALSTSNTSYTRGNFYTDSGVLRMHLWSNTGHDGFVGTRNKIDLTHYSKIRFVVNYTYTNTSDYPCHLCATSINDDNGASNGVIAQNVVSVPIHEVNTSTRTYDVDVSGVSGSYYVGFLNWAWCSEFDFRVCTVQLIP